MSYRRVLGDAGTSAEGIRSPDRMRAGCGLVTRLRRMLDTLEGREVQA